MDEAEAGLYYRIDSEGTSTPSLQPRSAVLRRVMEKLILERHEALLRHLSEKLERKSPSFVLGRFVETFLSCGTVIFQEFFVAWL